MSASHKQADELLTRLEWTVIRKLDGLLQGDYRTLFRGFGLDFADLREYQSTDDVRHIDWNVTARTQVPHVRVYNEDREITAWFLLDLTPSVDFGTVDSGREKRTVLVDLVVTLARILTRRGNRVGALVLGHEVEIALPARGGRLQVLRLIADLESRPRLDRAPHTDLAPLFETALRTIKRRSVVIVVSDFICEPGWERPLSMLERRHELLAIRIEDPREVELPDIGPVILGDAETGETLYVDTSDRALRQRFAAAAAQREAGLRRAFGRAGVEVVSLSTEDDLVRAIVRMAMLRRHRRRR